MSRPRRWFAALCPLSDRRRAAPRLGGLAETLEHRMLPAGNVGAIVADGSLVLTGDDAANSVEVTHTAAGIVVRGFDGTTINGSAEAFVAIAGHDVLLGDLRIDLGAADDVVLLSSDLHVAGDVRVRTGQGVDSIGLAGVTIDGDVNVHGGPDATLVHIGGADIGGDVRLSVGTGASTIALDDASVGDDLRVRSRAGATAIAIQSTTVGDDARLHLGPDGDNLLLEDVTIGDQAQVRTHGGADFVMFDSVDIDDRTLVRLGNSADSFILAGVNTFGQRFEADGGHGEDGEDVSQGSAFDGRRRERRFESDDVPAAVIGDRLNNATTGLLTRVNALAALFHDLPTPSLPLVLDVSENEPVASNGTQIVSSSPFVIRATTAPGATVQVDRDGDGAFDDGTVVADSQGVAVVTVTLLHSSTNLGANALVVRTTLGNDQATETLNVHYAVGAVVRFNTSEGTFDVELLNDDAPNTVANFLNYLSRFTGSIIHRSAHNANGSDFIIQGGAFSSPPALSPIATDPAINTEFNAANSNLRGTLSMALPPGNPSGATSQWFINTADNAFLDAAQHTVFGRVIGTGLTVVDAIHDLPVFNLVAAYDNAALPTVPLDGYAAFTQVLTGTVSIAAGSMQVTGVGTVFTSELQAGGAIQIGTQTFTIVSIVSDTQLTLNQTHTAGASAVTARTNAQPAAGAFVTLNSLVAII